MKATAIFVLICVLGNVLSTNTELSRLETSDFGRTLLDTIQIEMDSKEPIQNLLNLLTGMDEQLQKDQAAKDEAHKAYQEKCAADLANYKAHVDDAKNKITRSTNLLKVLHANLTRTEGDLENVRHLLKETEEELQSTHDQRKEEAEEYKTKRNEHESSRLAIGKFKSIISRLLSKQSSFLETKASTFAKATAELESTFKVLKDTTQKTIFEMLISIAKKVPIQSDQEVVQKILDLCDKILDNIEQSAILEKNAEDHRIEVYNEKVKDLKGDISELNGEIASLNTIIAGLKERIGVNEKIIVDQTERRNTNQQNWNDRNNECNAELAAYNQDTKKRNDERSTIADVIQIIKSRIQTLRDYIKKRLDNHA